MKSQSGLRAVIADILRRNWDPVDHTAAAVHEEFVSRVYELVATGASAREIAIYLVSVETTVLGFQDTQPESLLTVANKLRKGARR